MPFDLKKVVKRSQLSLDGKASLLFFLCFYIVVHVNLTWCADIECHLRDKYHHQFLYTKPPHSINMFVRIDNIYNFFCMVQRFFVCLFCGIIFNMGHLGNPLQGWEPPLKFDLNGVCRF